jgi:ketosteroid isomerase-like protein
MTADLARAFRTGIESGDMESVISLLADDVVFHSPIVYADYVGRDAVAPILRGVAVVFEDFTYTAEYDSPDGHVLAFAARVGDRGLEGVDILRVVDGRIAEFTVMVRPYSAATALRERMAALLAG